MKELLVTLLALLNEVLAHFEVYEQIPRIDEVIYKKMCIVIKHAAVKKATERLSSTHHRLMESLVSMAEDVRFGVKNGTNPSSLVCITTRMRDMVKRALDKIPRSLCLSTHGTYNDLEDRDGYSLWKYIAHLREEDVLHFLAASPVQHTFLKRSVDVLDLAAAGNKRWCPAWGQSVEDIRPLLECFSKSWVITHMLDGEVYSVYRSDHTWHLRTCKEADLIHVCEKYGDLPTGDLPDEYMILKEVHAALRADERRKAA